MSIREKSLWRGTDGVFTDLIYVVASEPVLDLGEFIFYRSANFHFGPCHAIHRSVFLDLYYPLEEVSPCDPTPPGNSSSRTSWQKLRGYFFGQPKPSDMTKPGLSD